MFPRLSQYDAALTGLTIHCVNFLANAMSLTLVQTLHATKLLPILYIRNSFKTSIALLNMKLGSGELPSSQPTYLTTSWKGLGLANLFKRDERLVTVNLVKADSDWAGRADSDLERDVWDSSYRRQHCK
jgi:hypothetical protein